MGRLIRTDQELQKASEHLHYEFWMLTSLANALASGVTSPVWLKNALLESFVIHFRGFVDFFYGEGHIPDDVIAADYFSPGEGDGLRPPQSAALNRAKRRAHKEVAHLTYERLNVTPETKPWPFVSLASELQRLMNIFFANVPRNRLSLEWQSPESTGGQVLP